MNYAVKRTLVGWVRPSLAALEIIWLRISTKVSGNLSRTKDHKIERSQ
ncbi:hypothetical protein TNCV_3138711, partial [Trichonephila clavipes]